MLDRLQHTLPHMMIHPMSFVSLSSIKLELLQSWRSIMFYFSSYLDLSHWNLLHTIHFWCALIDLNFIRKLSILLFHPLDACFNPYNSFRILYTSSSYPLISKPCGYLKYTSFFNGPLIKVEFTSNRCIFHHLHVAMTTKVLMV